MRLLLEPQRQPRHEEQDLVAHPGQRGVERAELVAEQPSRARRRHDPERFIAEHNVARWTETGELDTYYLSRLSADAVPVLVDLPEPQRSCTLVDIADDLGAPDDWRSANLSRDAARDLLEGADPTCADRWSY